MNASLFAGFGTALLAIASALPAQAPPLSDSTMVLGMVNTWGIIRPEIARTDSGWVRLGVESYRDLMDSRLRVRHNPTENWSYEGTPWRLVAPGEADRAILSGALVELEDPYWFGWGVLSDYPSHDLAFITGTRTVGAVVPPWVSTPPIEPLGPGAAEIDSINLRVAPAAVVAAHRVSGPGGVSWIRYRATWPADPRSCSMLRIDGWIRDSDYDRPQQPVRSEGECDTAGKGYAWRTPLAVIEDGDDSIVMLLEEGWEYSQLQIRLLTVDSIGPVLPRGW